MAYIWVDVGGGNRYAISGTGAGTANDPFVLTFGGGGAGGAVDTELPAAAALADATANPTVPGVGCFGLVWNGATWDRLPGTTAGVKTCPIPGQSGVAAGAGAVGATTQRATLASDDPAVASLGVMDDWDESDRAKVNPIAGQAGVAGNTGVVTALTQRVVLATDVGLPAGILHIGQVDGYRASATASFARPNDTTAYAANDAIANSTSAPTVLTFSNMARLIGGGGIIDKTLLLTDQTTWTARVRLHLYNAAPTAINDNAGCTAPLYADRVGYQGYIDIPAPTTGGGSPTAAYQVNKDDRLEFVTAADRNLYGLPQILDAATPAAVQNFFFALGAVE